MKITKAVIPVAGLGTRFLPASKAIPKEMLTIVDRPTIQYIVEEVVASGIEEIILVTSEGKAAIENHFDYNFELETVLKDKGKDILCEEIAHISNLIDIVSVRQKKPLGLGHAIWTTRKLVGNCPFVVLLGDDLVLSDPPCTQQMINLFEDYQESIVAIQRVPLAQTCHYGIVEGAMVQPGLVRVEKMFEKPQAGVTNSELAIIGRYILQPEIFTILEGTKPGQGGEIQLTDALLTLAQRRPMYAYEFKGTRFDAGDKLGYLKAIIAFALRHPTVGQEFRKHIKEVSADLRAEDDCTATPERRSTPRPHKP